MAPVRQVKKIKEKTALQRAILWPGAEPWLWDRKSISGYATIPKTMPLVLQIMDDLSNGKPVSMTYLGLWCQTWDNGMLSAAKKDELAFLAGFKGERSVYTWKSRIQILQDLHFIDIKAGKSGPISNIIIWNPHKVIRYLHSKGKLAATAKYNSLLELANEIGATDMMDALPSDEAPSVFAAKALPAPPLPVPPMPGSVALPEAPTMPGEAVTPTAS